MRLRIGPAVLLSDFLCCDRFDIMDRVPEIKVPTLVIVGTQDEMTPVKYAQYLANKIPGSKLVIIEGATHSVATEKPDEVNEAIKEWREGL
jgi:pimeloyl-ACP methyl ester carboxylesterase